MGAITLQRAGWYAARLAAMDSREILHRIVEARRKVAWRLADEGWHVFDAIGDGPVAELAPLRARLARVPTGDATHPVAESLRRAAGGTIRFLGQDWPAYEGMPPESLWFHDPVTGKRWPGSETSAFSVDVRSTGIHIGDVKYVWECNRLQMIHPIAAAIARADHPALRQQALGIVRGWAAANPPYRGVNWVSGIELAMRLVTIALLCAALRPDTLASPDRILIRRMVAAHARHLHAFPSRFSSANNHLVAEGLGLLIAGTLVADLPEAQAWSAEGRRILETEASRQILADGVGAEQSPTYQAFVMEMLGFAVRLAEDSGEPLAASVRHQLALGAEFLSWLLDDAGCTPQIGDDDEGRVLAQPPDREPRYVASVVAATAGLVGRPERMPAKHDPHIRDWLIGNPASQAAAPAHQGVRTFRIGGYTVARENIAGRGAHLVFDHGPLGYLSLAAHGHADALAVWLSIDDEPVFIDAGTHLYHSGGATRTRLRESLAHNTLAISDTSHSRTSGAFGWAQRADGFLSAAEPDEPWSVTGAHDGYRKRFGVRHERRVSRHANGYALEDRLIGARDSLDVSLRFLCDPGIEPVLEERAVVLRRAGREVCRVMAPDGFDARLEPGECSACFGAIEPTARLVLRGRMGRESARTVIVIANA